MAQAFLSKCFTNIQPCFLSIFIDRSLSGEIIDENRPKCLKKTIYHNYSETISFLPSLIQIFKKKENPELFTKWELIQLFYSIIFFFKEEKTNTPEWRIKVNIGLDVTVNYFTAISFECCGIFMKWGNTVASQQKGLTWTNFT